MASVDPETLAHLAIVLHDRLGDQIGAVIIRFWCSDTVRVEHTSEVTFTITRRGIPYDLPPTDDLEVHQMQVYGVGITCYIPDFPFFCRIHLWVFGCGTVPGDGTFHLTFKIGIDVGGTFTDFLLTLDDGTSEIYKTLSTPDDPSIATMRIRTRVPAFGLSRSTSTIEKKLR